MAGTGVSNNGFEQLPILAGDERCNLELEIPVSDGRAAGGGRVEEVIWLRIEPAEAGHGSE